MEKLGAETIKANATGALLEELQEPAVNRAQASTTSGPSPDDAKKARIREIIESSKFEWTTIGRVMKGTGLTHDEIIELVHGMQDIKISKGRRRGDAIFKFQ